MTARTGQILQGAIPEVPCEVSQSVRDCGLRQLELQLGLCRL